MNDEIELRDMLSRVKYITCSHTVSYETIARMHSDPLREIQHRVADMIAHSIAEEILGKGDWLQTTEPEGERFRVRGYWLTYEEMFSLLDRAYQLGRSKAPVIKGLLP